MLQSTNKKHTKVYLVSEAMLMPTTFYDKCTNISIGPGCSYIFMLDTKFTFDPKMTLTLTLGASECPGAQLHDKKFS